MNNVTIEIVEQPVTVSSVNDQVTVEVIEESVSIEVGSSGPQGATGVVAATSPITYNYGAQSVGLDQSALNTTLDSRYARLDSANAFTVGGHTITNAVASVLPLRINAASGQSVNLTEWYDGLGGLAATVNANGYFRSAVGFASTTSGITTLRPNFDTSGWGFVIGGAAQKGFVVRGAASQTASLTEWQDATPTTVASMAADGQLTALATNSQYVQGRPSTSFPYITFSGNALVLRTRQPSYLGLVVQGEAAQTQDITRWQSSTATVYLRVDSGGNLFANSSSANYAVGTNVGVKASSSAAIPLSIAAATGQTADLTRWYSNDGTTVMASVTNGGGASFGGVTTGTFTSILTVRAGGASQVGVAIGTLAGTSDDALRIFNASGGSTIAKITNAGDAKFASLALGNGTIFGSSAWLNIQTTSAAHIGAIIKGTTGQTGDLLQLQGDTGNVLVAVYASGTAVFNNRVVIGGDASARLNVVSSSASQVQAVIRGAASQTADLTQWQASGGSVSAGVTAGGAAFFGRGTAFASTVLSVSTAAATNVGLVIQGAASQTADAFQIQNNSSQVMAKIDGNGFGVFGGGTAIANSLISSTPYGTTQVGVAIKVAASATADAFQIYNSSNTLLTAVSAFGALSVRNGGVATLGGLAVSAMINTGNVNNVGVGVQGQANQYNDLIRFADSSGTTLGGRNSNGQFFAGRTEPIYMAVGGATTAASGDGTTATITTTSAHGLAVGDMVQVAGITPTGYNGTFRVTAVPTTTTFSYANATTGAQTVAGSVSAAAAATVMSRSAATAGLIVRGHTGQYRFIVQDNTGGSYNFYVNQYGNTQANSGMTVTGSMGASPVTLSALTSGATQVGLMVRGFTSHVANLTEWQNSSSTVVASVSASGVGIFTNLAAGTSGSVFMAPESSGGYVRLTKATAALANPSADQGKLYFRDGTNAGTLKLVVRAGAGGAETTILDNIPQ